MTNVVTIRDDIDLKTEPVLHVIEYLERLLIRAKAGEIRAVGVAVVTEGKGLATGWEGASGTRDSLGLCVGMLQHRYMAAIVNRD